MPQRAHGNRAGAARLTRSVARLDSHESVARRRQEGSYPKRWHSPTVIYVTDGGDAWSAYLRRMMSLRGITASELARRSGLHRATISEWLNKGVGAITIQSVYLIADALEDDRTIALRAAGNLPPERDAEVDLILASDRTEREKAAMIDRLMLRREEERQRRIDDLRWMLDSRDAGDGAA